MRRRPSVMSRATAVITCIVLLGSLAGCEAKVYGSPQTRPDNPNLTMEPKAPVDNTPAAPPIQMAAFDGLPGPRGPGHRRRGQAGADITVAVLDRDTGQLVTNGPGNTIAIASVAKLFIADDLLLQVAQGQTQLSPADQQMFDVMLRSSDDSAAETFWNRSGGSAIINRVVARYGLGSTRPPGDGRWWNTISSATDLVRYYDMLLNGAGGLPARAANIILNDLAQSTPTRRTGWCRRLPAAVRHPGRAFRRTRRGQAGLDVLHRRRLDASVDRGDRRGPALRHGDQLPAARRRHGARATITQAVKTMFPGGRI